MSKYEAKYIAYLNQGHKCFECQFTFVFPSEKLLIKPSVVLRGHEIADFWVEVNCKISLVHKNRILLTLNDAIKWSRKFS